MTRYAMISARAMGALPRFIKAEAGTRGLARACAAAGLPCGIESVDDRYITQRALMTFVDEVARLVGDERLGIELARYMTPDDYGTYGAYLLSAPTLIDALERSRRALLWHSAHDEISIDAQGDFVRYSWRFASAGTFGYENIAYCAAGVLVNLIRGYLGGTWCPHRIELDVSSARGVTRATDSFGCDVRPGGRQVTVVIPRSLLATQPARVRAGPTVTLADIERVRGRGAPKHLIDVVSELVRMRLADASVSLDSVAELLALGSRTLQRQLEQEGLQFRDVVNRARLERAQQLLAERDLSITRIATELGYSAPSHFTRAFHRETGVSPRQYRRRLVASGA